MQKIGNKITSFLDWIVSLPPDQLSAFEYAIAGYMISIKLVNPEDKMLWISAGFAGYGFLKAIDKLIHARNQPVIIAHQ
jgi:hypothetical protein